MDSAYLLVSHGSRDPRPKIAMEQLAELVSQSSRLVGYVQAVHNTNHRLARPQISTLVGTAYLELSPTPMHEQIKEFGDRAVAIGCNRIQVVPLFLLPGVHVIEDIPAEVELAKLVSKDLQIELRPHLGTHPGLSQLLVSQVAATREMGWIILAHGSRRAGAKEPVEAIAKQLHTRSSVAVSAYWAVPPRLESRVKELVDAGCEQIGILPYFLFAGGITDAIADSVAQLQVQFSDTLLQLAEPIGASAELAELIVDLIDK